MTEREKYLKAREQEAMQGNRLDTNAIVSREYVSAPRYGYGAIDQYVTDRFGNKGCLSNTMSGSWLTQKASRWIADSLNEAYRQGKQDRDREIQIEKEGSNNG